MSKQQSTPITPVPKTSIETTEPTAEEVKNRAPLLVSMHDINLCTKDLADLIIQGVREDNGAKRGSVAMGLRRAAHRIEKLNLEGFITQENQRMLPWPDTKVIFDFLRKLQEELGETIREQNKVTRENKFGEMFSSIQKFLAKHDAPKKTKTMEG